MNIMNNRPNIIAKKIFLNKNHFYSKNPFSYNIWSIIIHYIYIPPSFLIIRLSGWILSDIRPDIKKHAGYPVEP